jgi:chemotaxis protein methyltransferase WspC
MLMTSPDFIGLLRRAMGLDATSIGTSAVENAVRVRLTALGIADPQAYWELVSASGTELQALIEAVVVPETWFFRHPEAFTALTQYAIGEWLPGNPDGTFRVLSLPCSTGEEPYSIAMTLHEAGMAARRYRIDAVDISANALAHAKRGIYRNNSFRGDNLAFRSRHFAVTGDGYRLTDVVRESVRFHRGNLFADDLLTGARYDAVFCRNLLIYFDNEMQDRALGILQRLLKPRGLLFVGPSEGALSMRHGFDSVRVPLSFAFRRSGIETPLPRPSPKSVAAIPRTLPAPTLQPETTVAGVPEPIAAAVDPVSTSAALDEAFELADQGHLAAAARICEEHMRQQGPSAQAFHLLGLIASADGDLAAAAGHYRKALYLDRGHHDSLVHLSLLLEREGDVAAARILRDRMQRLQAASAGS